MHIYFFFNLVLLECLCKRVETVNKAHAQITTDIPNLAALVWTSSIRRMGQVKKYLHNNGRFKFRPKSSRRNKFPVSCYSFFFCYRGTLVLRPNSPTRWILGCFVEYFHKRAATYAENKCSDSKYLSKYHNSISNILHPLYRRVRVVNI